MENFVPLFEKFIDDQNAKTIRDFPYVMDFFNSNYPGKGIDDIPVYIISHEEWPDGKGMQTENDLHGGIRMHEDLFERGDNDIGWLIHEVGHVLDLHGERKPVLVSKNEFEGYPNEDNEQTPMWYQFHYFINKGLSEDDVISLEKRDYSDVKGGGCLWSQYKDDFFRAYYKAIKDKL
jgi:hypothetical protein